MTLTIIFVHFFVMFTYRAIAKPTKDKPMMPPALTEDGYHVAFYTESSEGPHATAIQSLQNPVLVRGPDIPRAHKKYAAVRPTKTGMFGAKDLYPQRSLVGAHVLPVP